MSAKQKLRKLLSQLHVELADPAMVMAATNAEWFCWSINDGPVCEVLCITLWRANKRAGYHYTGVNQKFHSNRTW